MESKLSLSPVTALPEPKPPPIREALSMCVGDAHSNREGPLAKREKVGESEIERFSPTEVPLPAKQLLQTYKVWKL